ncbi:MAG: rhombosortase [Gammaproteobacteria bacterium]|nr:MAG: rhombosortase [Gammaproteobacteria bacterium]
MLGLQAGGDSLRQCLQYDREAIQVGELWRLLTGHVVHLGWRHAILNLTALFLLAAAFHGVFDRHGWILVTLGSLVAVDIGLWALAPQVAWYVGLSGVLHGLVSAAAVGLLAQRRVLGAIALGVVSLKIVRELWSGASPAAEAWLGGDVVVTAHLWGAVGGILVAVSLIRTRGHTRSL